MSAVVSLDAIDKPGPIHPAADPQQDALLRWAEANAVERDTPPITGGRYRIPDPETGKKRGWTRMSTLAKTLDDDTAITKWEKANVARGLLADPGMLTRISDPRDLVAAAGRRGGDYLKADLGTAMHTALERHVLGLDNTGLPAPYDQDLAVIVDALARHRIVADPNYLEAVMCYPAFEAAGRLDLCAKGPWGDTLRVCDLKTGSTDFGIGVWAAQLAGYARAPYHWRDGELHPAFARDAEVGMIIHAPLGQATCHIYELDLIQGHEILTAAHEARRIRNGNQGLMVPHIPPAAPLPVSDTSKSAAKPEAAVPAAEPVHISEPLAEVVGDLEARTDTWLAGRIAALAGQEAAMRVVRLAWPPDTLGTPPWTAEQRPSIEAALIAGEAAVRAPFPVERPAEPTPDPEPLPPAAAELRPRPDAGGLVDAKVCHALAEEVRQLDELRVVAFRRWLVDAQAAGRMLDRMVDHKPWPDRTYAVVVAMNACLAHLWDADDPDALTRAAMAVLLGDDQVQPTFTTGGLFGTLTPDEARRLTQIALAFGRSEPDICAQLGAAVTSQPNHQAKETTQP